jgi:hypothetical protein
MGFTGSTGLPMGFTGSTGLPMGFTGGWLVVPLLLSQHIPKKGKQISRNKEILFIVLSLVKNGHPAR